MNKGSRNLRLVGALALTAFVGACGGGGGGGGSKGSGSATAAGTAAKGIISGAVVTGYRADGTEIGSTTTAEDGTYKLGLKGYSGPVRLVMSPPEAPDVALVTCDASDCGPADTGDQDTDTDGAIEFGERYVLDYELSAIVNVDKTSKTVSAHITPLTTLVEKRATAGGAILQPETVAVANNFVRQMLGLDTDPTLVKPVDLTAPDADGSDARALRYAVMNAAFESAAMDSARAVSDVLNDMADDFNLNQVEEGELERLWQAMEDIADTASEALENQDLGDAITAASDAARDDLYTAAMDICSGPGDCQVEVVIEGPVGTNLEAAKALVATTRAVTLGALDSIDEELEQYQYDEFGNVLLDGMGEPVPNENYDPNNTFAQIQQLTALNENTGYLTEAFGEVMGVVLSQAFVAVSAEGEPELDLQTAAGAFFDDDRAMDCSWYVEPELTICVDTNTSERADFVARFSDTTIVHAGTSWSVTGVTYTPQAEDGAEAPAPVTVNVELTLPESLELAATQHEIGVSGSATSGFGSVTVNEAGATVTLMESLNLASEEDVTPKFSAISLAADAEISDGTDTFSGAFGVQFKRSASHAALNPHSELNGLMPKSFTLNGAFVDGDQTDSPLDIDVTLTIGNAELYKFYEEGYERNDLTTYVYNETENTVTVTHGLPANRVVVKFWPEIVPMDGFNNAYVRAEILEQTGDAWFEGSNVTHQEGDGYWKTYTESLQPCIENLDQNGWFWLLVEDTCYEWDENVSITEDVRYAFRNSWIREILNRMVANVPGEGEYAAGAAWDDNYENYGEDVNVFSSTSGSLTATLVDSDPNVNATNRYPTINFTASVVGRLAEELPEMDITLTGSRTGYISAVAGLTLEWGGEKLIVSYSTSNDGTVTVEDGVGTTMELTPGATDLEVGRIEKDGTVYGVITRESGVYLVTWLDGVIDGGNEIETLR